MDPRHGELSRAMRNRGIEICMLGEVSALALFKEITFMSSGESSGFFAGLSLSHLHLEIFRKLAILGRCEAHSEPTNLSGFSFQIFIITVC